jgi:hypothetical protein
MKNILFFLWMMFMPLVEDIATWVVWKTRGENMKDDSYGFFAEIMPLVIYIIVAYLLYEK